MSVTISGITAGHRWASPADTQVVIRERDNQKNRWSNDKYENLPTVHYGFQRFSSCVDNMSREQFEAKYTRDQQQEIDRWSNSWWDHDHGDGQITWDWDPDSNTHVRRPKTNKEVYEDLLKHRVEEAINKLHQEFNDKFTKEFLREYEDELVMFLNSKK